MVVFSQASNEVNGPLESGLASTAVENIPPIATPVKAQVASAPRGDMSGLGGVAARGADEAHLRSLKSLVKEAVGAARREGLPAGLSMARMVPETLAKSLSPTAEILLRSQVLATALETPGSEDYEFWVVLPEPVALEHLGTGTVLVMGEVNDYFQMATLVAARGRTLRYRVRSPGGAWTAADNGVYGIYFVVDLSVPPVLLQAFSMAVKQPAANLLQNSHFELGLIHWQTFAGTEQILKTNTYMGDCSLLLSTQGSGTQQCIQVKPGMLYQLMGYGRSIAKDYRSFGMSFFDSQGRLLSRCDVGCIASRRWQDYFVVAIAPTHAAHVQVWTYQECTWGRTLINGLALRQVAPEGLPTPIQHACSIINTPLSPQHPLYRRWHTD